MKEGFAILEMYDDDFSYNEDNKGNASIRVCDEVTALNTAVEFKAGIALVLSNDSYSNIIIRVFHNGNLVFYKNVSKLLMV